MSVKILPCTGRVDDGCVADLVYRGCSLTAAVAIVAVLGRAAANTAM